MVVLPKGCKEVKIENIEIVRAGQPRSGMNKNIWGVDISYKYKCPSCGKLDNSQKSEWFFEPQHKIYSSDTCNNSSCKKSYKAELILKCDFSEFKKGKETKQESPAIETEDDENEIEFEPEIHSQAEKGNQSELEEYFAEYKPGFFERQIIKIARFVYFFFADRKGNILFVILGIAGIIMNLFEKKFDEIKEVFPGLLIFLSISIFRSYKIYKDSEQKIHEQLRDDCLGGFRNIVKIFKNQKY